MKKLMFGMVVVISFLFVACGSKDAEINAYISDSDKLANEIVQKIKSNPTAAGVDEAQRLLDSKKADLKAKYDLLKSVRGYEVKEETMKNLTDSVFRNAEAVNGLRIDYIKQSVEDQAFSQKIDKLINDFNSIYEV